MGTMKYVVMGFLILSSLTTVAFARDTDEIDDAQRLRVLVAELLQAASNTTPTRRLALLEDARNKLLEICWRDPSASATVVVLAPWGIDWRSPARLANEIDLVRNIYFLSEPSKQVTDGIEEPVTIYVIYPPGDGNPEIDDIPTDRSLHIAVKIDDILSLYADRSENITVKTLDPERSPTQADRFDDEGGLRTGDLVVASEDKHRVISVSSLRLTQNNRQIGLNVEQQVTSALLFVTSDQDPKIYSIIGHREQNVTALGLRQILEIENFALEDLNLLQVEAVPEDATIVMVAAPTTDYTEEEVAKLRAYLEGGGKAIFALSKVNDVDLVNLNSLLRSYGVQYRQEWVIERDSRRHLPNQPNLLVPEVVSHAITSPISLDRRLVVLPGPAWIEELEVRRRSLEVQPLMASSAEAFARAELTLTESGELLPQEGDPRGPFTLAVAITDSASTAESDDARIVVLSTAFFLRGDFQEAFPGNVDLMVNSINWVLEREESISSIPFEVTLLMPTRLNSGHGSQCSVQE